MATKSCSVCKTRISKGCIWMIFSSGFWLLLSYSIRRVCVANRTGLLFRSDAIYWARKDNSLAFNKSMEDHQFHSSAHLALANGYSRISTAIHHRLGFENGWTKIIYIYVYSVSTYIKLYYIFPIWYIGSWDWYCSMYIYQLISGER